MLSNKKSIRLISQEEQNKSRLHPLPLPQTPSLRPLLTYQNTKVPTLTLKIIEDSSGKTLAYSWVESGSERVGINTRWAQAGLTVQPGEPSFGFNRD